MPQLVSRHSECKSLVSNRRDFIIIPSGDLMQNWHRLQETAHVLLEKLAHLIKQLQRADRRACSVKHLPSIVEPRVRIF